jgi:hypothetical protein
MQPQHPSQTQRRTKSRLLDPLAIKDQILIQITMRAEMIEIPQIETAEGNNSR